MNKVQLAHKLAKRVAITQKQSEEIIKELFDLIIEELANGNTVNIAGFGSFQAKYRHARAGVHPLDPQKRIEIPATTVAKFKAGLRLKKALKNKK